jgi:hypothetical protein
MPTDGTHGLVWLLAAAGAFLIAAHVGSEVALIATSSPRAAVVYFWPAALAVGVIGYVRLLPPPRDRPQQSQQPPWWRWARDWVGSGTALLVVATAAAAWAEVLLEFMAAYLVCPLYLLWIDVAFARGAVRYDPHARGFVVTRAASYAVVRGTTAACVRHLGLPAPLARLVPATVAALESWGMLLADNRSYAFSARTAHFAAYTTFKLGLFVAVPFLEETLTTTAQVASCKSAP